MGGKRTKRKIAIAVKLDNGRHRDEGGFPLKQSVLKLINRDYNGLIACGLSEQEIISTGIPQLDMITGGGIPKGRIVEIHGAEGSGKTALALHLAQQFPGPMLYADADHGLSPYMLHGVEGYLLSVDSLEKTMDACITAAGSGAFGAIVIDTVAALPTNEEIGLGIMDWSYAKPERQAKVISKALPILAPVLHHTGCTLILVNQLRKKPGISRFEPGCPTGGMAIGYYAALRLRTARIAVVMEGGRTSGQAVKVTVTKCKYAPPGKQTEIQLIYGEGLQP